MFVLAKETIWVWPVVVKLPREGQIVETHFRAKFKLVPDEMRHHIAASYNEQEVQDRTRELLSEALLEVYDVLDEHEAPLRLTPEVKAALLGNSFVMRGLADAYGESLRGVPTAAELGNSVPSGGPG